MLGLARICCRFGRCTFTRLQIALATLVRQSLVGSLLDQYAYRGGIITVPTVHWPTLHCHGPRSSISTCEEDHVTKNGHCRHSSCLIRLGLFIIVTPTFPGKISAMESIKKSCLRCIIDCSLNFKALVAFLKKI